MDERNVFYTGHLTEINIFKICLWHLKNNKSYFKDEVIKRKKRKEE